IAIGNVPPDRPDKADRAANIERRSPSQMRHDEDDERRSNGGTKTTGAMRQPLDETALFAWKPKLHRARGSRKGASLSNSEQKAHHDERDRARRRRGGCRHYGPVCNDRPQHRPPAKAVVEPAAGHLEESICPHKSTEDHPHGDLVKAELLADDWSSRRNIDPIQIGDEIHQAN